MRGKSTLTPVSNMEYVMKMLEAGETRKKRHESLFAEFVEQKTAEPAKKPIELAKKP